MRYTWPIIIIVPILTTAGKATWAMVFLQFYLGAAFGVWVARGIIERLNGMDAKGGQN